MRGLSVAIALATAAMGTAGTARSEDFTGFYAGVNAGYGLGRDGASATAIAPTGRPTEKGLPPSALDAARAMTSAPRPSPQVPSLPR